MNENSLICRFISEHEDWRDRLKNEYKISIKDDAQYSIFNYGVEANLNEPLVQEANGIIINRDTLEVVCWPFRKFGYYDEEYADSIDWSTAIVQEKDDGIIMKLWWDAINDKWELSSNDRIHAEDEITDEENGVSLVDLFHRAVNYPYLKHSNLEKQFTYIFDLDGYKKTLTTVDPDEIFIWHIGTRDNASGQEYDINIDIEKPVKFAKADSLESCMEIVSRLNYSCGFMGVVHEGVVVVDADWNRIKIKTPEYMMLSELTTGSMCSKIKLLDMVASDSAGVELLCLDYPEYEHWFRYYQYKYSEVCNEIRVFVDSAVKAYKKFGMEYVDKAIEKHKYREFAIQCINEDRDINEVLDSTPIEILERYIPSYVSK